MATGCENPFRSRDIRQIEDLRIALNQLAQFSNNLARKGNAIREDIEVLRQAVIAAELEVVEAEQFLASVVNQVESSEILIGNLETAIAGLEASITNLNSAVAVNETLLSGVVTSVNNNGTALDSADTLLTSVDGATNGLLAVTFGDGLNVDLIDDPPDPPYEIITVVVADPLEIVSGQVALKQAWLDTIDAATLTIVDADTVIASNTSSLSTTGSSITTQASLISAVGAKLANYSDDIPLLVFTGWLKASGTSTRTVSLVTLVEGYGISIDGTATKTISVSLDEGTGISISGSAISANRSDLFTAGSLPSSWGVSWTWFVYYSSPLGGTAISRADWNGTLAYEINQSLISISNAMYDLGVRYQAIVDAMVDNGLAY